MPRCTDSAHVCAPVQVAQLLLRVVARDAQSSPLNTQIFWAIMPAKHHRIVRGEDYRRIVRSRNRVGGANSITHAVSRVSPDDPARFGFIVSKAVGNAVTRNLVRRRMKSIVETQINNGFMGYDVVFRLLPSASGADFSDLETEVSRALERIKRRESHTETRTPS